MMSVLCYMYRSSSDHYIAPTSMCLEVISHILYVALRCTCNQCFSRVTQREMSPEDVRHVVPDVLTDQMTFEQRSVDMLSGHHNFPLWTQVKLCRHVGSFVAYHEVHVHQRRQKGHPQYCSCLRQVPSPDLFSARQSLLLPLTTTLMSSADSLISVAHT